MRRLLERINRPFAEWGGLYAYWDANRKGRTAHELARAADALAERAARFSAYVGARLNGATHARAVREQNRVAGRVRKALGYTVGRADVEF